MTKSIKAVGFICIFALVSCQSNSFKTLADRAYDDGNYSQALKYYVYALDNDPELKSDKGFMSKANNARVRLAYEYSKQSTKEKNYVLAYQQLKFAQQYNSDAHLANLIEADLEEALKNASNERYMAGLEYADQGDMVKAKLSLEEAIVINEENDHAKAALSSFDKVDTNQLPKGYAQYLEANGLIKNKRYAQAEATLREAIGLNPNLLYARQARSECNAKMNEADGLVKKAQVHLSNGEKREAIPLLEQAVKVWPYQEFAGGKLASIKGDIERADKLKEDAQVSFREKKLIEAMKLLEKVVELDPQDKEADALAKRIRREAATALSSQGSRLLASGNHEQARLKFEQALMYDPEYLVAKDGISRITFLRGLEAEGEEKWAEALMWYIQAASYHTRENAYQVKLQNIALKLISDKAITLKVEVSDAKNWGLLETELKRQLATSRPAHVTFTDETPSHQVTLAVSRMNVTRNKLESKKVIKTFKTVTRGPNPRFTELTMKVRALEAGIKSAEGDQKMELIAEHKLVSAELAQVPFITDFPVENQWIAEDALIAKVGQLETVGTVNRTGHAASRVVVNSKVSHSDQTIINPNLELGIKPDSLDVPTDAVIKEELQFVAAKDIANQLYYHMADQMSAGYHAEADGLIREKKNTEAAKALMKAAAWWVDVDNRKAFELSKKALSLWSDRAKQSL